MDYKQKYLKYKSKYLALQIGHLEGGSSAAGGGAALSTKFIITFGVTTEDGGKYYIKIKKDEIENKIEITEYKSFDLRKLLAKMQLVQNMLNASTISEDSLKNVKSMKYEDFMKLN